ncbi:hypothetical protein QWJ46_01515 [Rhizobium sp. CBN3]|uniref:hypothetical protein n=1 Tax=Rhizobium sp. CBN3 TaxID=3058045 RepID=UPI002673447F|nr:hypothetical protein [Rhizobium sp. CBN3]MDO3431351.1 hypothetical protein [Rhizobium sp. CBN3]
MIADTLSLQGGSYFSRQHPSFEPIKPTIRDPSPVQSAHNLKAHVNFHGLSKVLKQQGAARHIGLEP